MEQFQETIRKLIAFAALVVVLAGVPHFLLDRKAAASRTADRSYEYLLPSEIGKFHVVNRWRNAQASGPLIEQGAIYQNVSGGETAQFDIMINASGYHNGLICYLTRGMTLQSRSAEQVQAADSSAIFDVGFVGDQSMSGAGHSTLFVASTECGAGGCRPAPPELGNEPRLMWLETAQKSDDARRQSLSTHLSITFQSLQDGGRVSDQEALTDFRELVSNFRLVPLREISGTR